MKLTLSAIKHQTSNIYTLEFQPERPLEYVAGQFITLLLPHQPADERGTKHWFTLSSSPTEDHLAITTRNYGDQASSFKKHLFALQPGAELEFLPPEGDFVLPDDPNKPLVFIAGGIGITPFRSMIQYLVDSGQQRSIKLIYGVQQPDELVFKDLFESYGIELKAVVGERLTAQLLLDQIDDQALAYLSGPEPMVESLHDQLMTLGLPEARLKTDYFPGYENQYSR